MKPSSLNLKAFYLNTNHQVYVYVVVEKDVLVG